MRIPHLIVISTYHTNLPSLPRYNMYMKSMTDSISGINKIDDQNKIFLLSAGTLVFDFLRRYSE